MKIRIQGFENEIVFDDESVNILQISNKILLQNIMEKIFCKSGWKEKVI